MLRNFFTVMFRQFAKNKLYVAIQILCLAVGMAVSLLIMLFVLHEKSYDNFHERRDSIYQMVVGFKRGDNVDKTAVSTPGIGPSLLEEFPEITRMTRLMAPTSHYFVVNNKSLFIYNLVFADSSVFDIFSFHLKSGNPDFALTEPFTMVVTEEMGNQFFGDVNPVGKILRFEDKYNFRITGIVENPPSNSHIQFNALLSFASLYKMDGYFMGWDGGWNYFTYVTVAEGIDWEKFNEKLVPFMDEHINNKYRTLGVELSLNFDPLQNVYLYSSAPESQTKSGNRTNLIVFSAIAFFILLIACINFMNLSTARFSRRTKETGMRKILGAGRVMLIWRYLAETLFISFIALILALVIVELMLPGFSRLFDAQISFYKGSGVKLFALMLIIWIITGIVAGSYPAFFLSGMSPLLILKGGTVSVSKGKSFRNILVIFQFFIAAALIISTLTIQQQLTFFYRKDLGYYKENLMVLSLSGEKSMKGFNVLKNELKSLPYVVSSGASTGIPGTGLSQNGYLPEGQTESMLVNVIDVDQDYLKTLGISIINGSGFSVAESEDYLVNQSFAKLLGWDSPVGKVISRNGKHHIAGLVKDFHFASLDNKIEPLIITNKPWEGSNEGFNYLTIRLSDEDYAKAIGDVEAIWRKLFPTEPYIFQFMDLMQKSAYNSMESFGIIFKYGAFLAIFIACLGLFGLTTFITQQRTKEIGIRKTFGANASEIVFLLGKSFLVLVVFGNLLAWPLAWYLTDKWLDNFAFRAPWNIWIYPGTLAIALIMSLLTVIWHSLKASLQNPVDSLKYE